jgi:hypothetical protein
MGAIIFATSFIIFALFCDIGLGPCDGIFDVPVISKPAVLKRSER